MGYGNASWTTPGALPGFLEAVKLVHMRCSAYRIEFEHDEAVDVIKALYPNRDTLLTFIEKVNRIMPDADRPRCEEPDYKPHKFHTWMIGREGSVVLYLDVCKNYAMSKKAEYWDELMNMLTRMGRNFHADEVEIEEVSPVSFRLRFWWD